MGLDETSSSSNSDVIQSDTSENSEIDVDDCISHSLLYVTIYINFYFFLNFILERRFVQNKLQCNSCHNCYSSHNAYRFFNSAPDFHMARDVLQRL